MINAGLALLYKMISFTLTALATGGVIGTFISYWELKEDQKEK